MFPRALVLAMLGALGAPAAAFGATASVATETGSTPVAHGPPLTELRSTYSYVAGPGEQNQPALTLTEGGRVLTISDAGASIAPGDGCASVGPSEVRCIAPAGATIAPLVTVALGDGDDVLGVFGGERSVAIDAGPGADHVAVARGEATGGEGDDVLRASGTYASLDGGPGSDLLQGGNGGDSLIGGAGRDRIDGGSGSDVVGFGGETQTVTVDLSRPGPGGTAAEPDDLRNVEGASGGRGDDLLRGSAGDNLLNGGPGRDVIYAGDGDDQLNGGPGADQVRAGSGNDTLVEEFVPSGVADRLQGQAGNDRIYSPSRGATLLGGTGRDLLQFESGAVLAAGGAGNDELEGSTSRFVRLRASCGAGRDSIINVAERQPIPADCELTTVGVLEGPVSTRVRVGRSTVTVGLPDVCDPRCRVRVVLRIGSRELGATSKRIRSGRATARIRLSPRSYRRLRRARTLSLTYTWLGDQFPRTITVRL